MKKTSQNVQSKNASYNHAPAMPRPCTKAQCWTTPLVSLGVPLFPLSMNLEIFEVVLVGWRRYESSSVSIQQVIYLMTLVTMPVATVLPPSRILKRCPFSIATGLYMSHIISTLSPGNTILESRSSVPSGQ